MGDVFRGLTIRIGADASSLKRELRNINSAARSTQSSLRAIEKAARLDPSSIALANLRVKTLAESAGASAAKVANLRRQIGQLAGKASRLDGTRIGRLAQQTDNAALAAKRWNSAYEAVNASLEKSYKLVAKLNTRGLDETTEGFKEAKRAAQGLARTNFEAFGRQLESALSSKYYKQGGAFDIGVDTSEYVAEIKRLRSEWDKLESGLSDAKDVAHLEKLREQLAITKAEMRSAASEAVEARSALNRMAAVKTDSYAKAAANVETLSAAAKEAAADAARMDEALRLDPTSMAAAVGKMRALGSQAGLVDAALEKARAQLDEMKAAGLDKVAASFDDVRAASAKVKSELKDATAEMETLEARARDASKTLRGMSEGDAGFERLADDLRRMESELTEAKSKVSALNAEMKAVDSGYAYINQQDTVTGLEAQAKAIRSSMTASTSSVKDLGFSLKNVGYSLYSTVTPAVSIAGSMIVQSADDFDQAYRDMRKTVNGTEEQFESLREAALEFSRTHWTSGSELLEIEAIGGQLGIAADNLGSFGEVVSNLDIATDMDTETISENLGQLSSIMDDLDQSKESGAGSLEAFSDALVRLGNNSAAQESKIMNVMMRIASTGATLDMTTPDLLAISTAVAATGQGAEAAGTAISKTFSNIESAVAGGGDSLEAFVEVVRQGSDEMRSLSSEDFARMWNAGGDSTSKAFTAFIEGLKGIKESGGSVDQTLKDLGINSVRQKQTLSSLTKTTDVLSESLGMSNDAWNGLSTAMGDGSIVEAGDAAREADRKMEGFSGSLKLLQNNFEALATSVGDGIAPYMDTASGLLSGATEAFGSLTDGAKQGAVGLALLSAAGGPVLVALGSIVTTVPTVVQGLAGMRNAWNAATAAMANSAVPLSRMAALNKNAAESMEAAGGAMTAGAAGAKAWSAMMKLAAGAAAALAIVLLDRLVAAVQEYIQFQNDLGDAAKSTADMMQSASASVAAATQSSGEAVLSADEVLDKYRSSVERMAESNRTLQSSFDETWSDSSLIEQYAAAIEELMGNVDGDSEKLAQLQVAVEGYNDVTGESISITDEQSGALENSEGNAIKSAEAFERLADAKINAAKAEVFADQYKTSYNEYQKQVAEQKDAQAALEKAQQDLADYQAAGGSNDDTLYYLAGQVEAAQTAVDGYSDAIGQLKSNMNQATEAQLLFTEAQQKGASELTKALAGNDDAQASIWGDGNSVTGFKGVVESLGLSDGDIDKVISNLSTIADSYDGTATSVIEALQEAGVAVDDWNDTPFENKDGKVTVKKASLTDAQGDVYTWNGTDLVDKNGKVVAEEVNLTDTLGNMWTWNGAELKSQDGEVTIKDGEIVDGIDHLRRWNGTQLENKSATATITYEYHGKQYESAYKRQKARNSANGGFIQGMAFAQHAMGGMLRAARHAAGGYIVTRPTVVGRTGNTIHIAGEAGAEWIEPHAGGIVPLTNRRYVRPFAEAVALEMGGAGAGGGMSVNVNLNYSAGDDANQMARDLGRSLKRYMRM